MKIKWTRTALQDLRATIKYIATDNPQAANRIGLQIEAVVQRLVYYPGLGRAGRVEKTREHIILGTPYILVYDATPTNITIFRVLHHSQNYH